MKHSLSLLILSFLLSPSVTQPLDFKRPQTCNYDDLRRGAIRQIRLADEKLRAQQSEYDSILKANRRLDADNSRLSETYENINNVSFCEINDDRFLFVTVQKNWYESEEFCNLIDRYLIIDEQMNANIIKILRQIGSNKDYWIGGIYRDDSWYWIKNNRPTDNITWAAWATENRIMLGSRIAYKCGDHGTTNGTTIFAVLRKRDLSVVYRYTEY